MDRALASSAMEPRVEYARALDGATVAYTVNGSGPTVVLLPMLPFNNFLDEWAIAPLRTAYERLAANFRLVQYDGRGTGHSQRDPGELTFDSLLADLDAVLAQVHASDAGLVGLFNTCPLALTLAATDPGRVSRLALYGGTARGWAPMRSAETQALLSLIEQDWELFTETAAHTWMGWSSGEAARDAARSFREGVTPAIARSMLQLTSGVDVSDRVGQVTQPTLVLHKPGLTQVTVPEARSLSADLADGHYLELPGESAALFMDGGDIAVEALVRFFIDGEAAATTLPSGAGGRALTTREGEVLHLLATGDSNAEIAAELGVSVHTVERHVANIYRKIEARGRADATAWAIRHGFG